MSPFTKLQQTLGFIAWIAVSFTASAIGAVASIQAKSFYSQLVQPGWAPPPEVFGPVWTVLYALMGISAWLVWRSAGFRHAQRAFTFFILQLALNSLWSWLFFAGHLGALAFVEVIILWFSILATIMYFWRVQPLAGVLLMPYLCWVGFAAVLNYSLWQLNPEILG